MDWILKVLDAWFGDTFAIFILVFVLGGLAVYLLPKYLVTVGAFDETKAELKEATLAGDQWNQLRILDLRLDGLRKELREMMNFIDMKQAGRVNGSQKARLEEIRFTIRQLEKEKKEILKQLTGGT